MTIFQEDIAVDMGTSTTLLYERKKGIAVREPTVVTVNRQTGRIAKVGQEAQKTMDRTPANMVLIHPMSAGVICDYEMAAQMLREYVGRLTSLSLFKPRILACVPSSITGVEERAMIDAAIEAGARRVYLLEKAVATAMGAGVDISKADGHMIIDIGGGTTEIAVVSANGVVESESIKVAGKSFDEAIQRYVRRKYKVLIGLTAAEETKRSIGCVMSRPDMGVEELNGRSLENAMPKTIRITSAELIEAFVDPMNAILDALHNVLERTPPQLVGDLEKNGIILSGGGSLIYGIDKLIERSTGIRTTVVDDPISCAAYGAGKMLRNLDSMQDGMLNFYRMRQLRA